MANERFESVWDAIEDTPEEALNMRLRSDLMIQITRRVKEWDVTQKEAAPEHLMMRYYCNSALSYRTVGK